MAKDFKAAQLRTSQIIASGSKSGTPSLIIASASSPSVNFDGGGNNTTVLASVGKDVFVFISGSKNSFGTTTQGVTLFGGDIVISGTAYNSAGNAYGNVAGSDKQVQFNDAGVFGASSGLTYDKNTQTLSVGNLIVTGTTTTVTSSNLVISDQVIYFGSGSKSSDTNGGIALASGSSVTNQSLVFGRVASDTWGAGRQDVISGTLTDLTGMTLVSLRASNFQIGGSSAVLSSSDGSNIIMFSGGSSLINIAPGTGGLKFGSSAAPVGVTGSNVRIGNRSAEFSNELPPIPGSDTYFFVSGSVGSKGTSVRGSSIFGGDLLVSGNEYVFGNLQVTGNLGLYSDVVLGTAGGSGPQITRAGDTSKIGFNSDGVIALNASNTPGEGTVKIQKNSVSYLVLSSTNSDSSANIATFKLGTDPGMFGFTSLTGKNLANAGSDVFFYVSGSAGSKDTATRGTAVFGGDTYVSGVSYFAQGLSGSLTKLTNGTSYLIAGAGITIATGSNGAITITNDGTVGDITSVTAGTGLTGGGTSGAVTLNINDGVVATVSGTTFTGVVKANSGISGSLTKLTDGSSYLIAGSNVNIITGSNGSVTIAGTVSQPTGTFNDVASKLSTTGTFAIAGSQGFNYFANNVGSDVNFFVSGSGNSKNTTIRGTSVFGGDVVISGTLLGGVSFGNTYLGLSANRITLAGGSLPQSVFTNDSNLYFSGSRGSRGSSTAGTAVFGGDILVSGVAYFPLGLSGSLTKLTDGTSYLVAGTGTTVTTGSTGAVTVGINNSIVATVSGTTFTGDIYTQNILVSGSATIAGNLTVNGTVTSISSSNLNIADPIIYIASGSVGTNTKSAIAFASGSSVTNQSLIFGALGSGNVMAAAKQDVQSGSLSQASLSFLDLVPVRASSFQIGGSSTALTSSDGQGVTLFSGGASFINIAPGSLGLKIGNGTNPMAVSGSDVRFGSTSAQFGNEIPPQPGVDSYFFVSGSTGSKGTSTKGTAVFGGDVVTSGTIYPGTDLGANLGSSTNRWGNIYTGDLHLKNDRGDYTLIEEEDCLTIRFNKTGKRYRFVLERAPEYDE